MVNRGAGDPSGNLRLTPGGTLVGEERAHLESNAGEKPRCDITNTEKDRLHERANDRVWGGNAFEIVLVPAKSRIDFRVTLSLELLLDR